MLLKKDGKNYNIITDGDVTITSPSKIGKTLKNVIDEQQSDIDRLKSNIKYIYAYGGVGGSGSGSGSGGSNEKPITVRVTLNGSDITTGEEPIILDGKGNYKLYVKIGNASGKTLLMGYTTDGSNVTDRLLNNRLNIDNRYQIELDVYLVKNNVLNISITDDEGNPIIYCSRRYIVDSDKFDISLNYKTDDGEINQYNSEPYECFVSDPNRHDRFFKIDYSIYLTNYTKVNIQCSIDGVGEVYNGDGSGIMEFPLDEIFIGDKSILNDYNVGTYTFRAKMSYIIDGREIVRERSFLFSIIPYDLYINVRTVGDILYDKLELLEDDILNSVEGIPYKCITQGSPLMMYSKVFEGNVVGNIHAYTLEFRAFDAVLNVADSDSDSDFNIISGWRDLGVLEKETVNEREESKNGISIIFPDFGIKKIEITTTNKNGGVYTFNKYLYVKPFSYDCDWYDVERYNNIMESYFKSNQQISYNNFPQLSSGNGVLSLLTSSTPIELSHSKWLEELDNKFCTVITLGIQVSDINSENAKIMDIYTTDSGEKEQYYSLRTTRLFTNVDDISNKIAIPTEKLDKNDNSKYHLVQIIRHLSDTTNDDESIYEDSLYIDGLIESVYRNTRGTMMKVIKLILNNINICYNLINVQYFSPVKKNGNDEYKFNPDAYAYQYWLSYKEKYVNSSLVNRLKDEEYTIVNNRYFDRICFDGTNVVVEDVIVKQIASISDLPTVIFKYDCKNAEGNDKILSEFMKNMWSGRSSGDKSFMSREIELYWIPERSPYVGEGFDKYKVNIPSNLIGLDNINSISGNWEIDLQGTSTMRNRIKNYSLRIKNNINENNGKILFSPKFNIDFKPEEQSFLPDLEWTIKADIADSAHANNTSIGKFVNDVCTKIDTNIHDIDADAKKFIKNTLEGIPVLLYFMCTGKDDDGIKDITKIYYFGIYNFNLGRKSYYNLGYTGGINETTGKSDYMTVFGHIRDGVNNANSVKYFKDQNSPFTFVVGEGKLSENIGIAEIQDNLPEFDFHQYQNSLLFKGNNESDIACMFGSNEKITSLHLESTKTALSELVKLVAKAGKFCFESVGRNGDFITSQSFTENNGEYTYYDQCVNRYLDYKIPDPMYQKRYNLNGSSEWFRDDNFGSVNETHLKDLITTYQNSSGKVNKPILNYNSAAEYYTICMAFGMVDSILKNMNLKNFKSNDEGPNFYCAFYDMDCALEENNAGVESISYLAATDFWYSEQDNKNRVYPITKKNDYWDSSIGGNGFDFTSSYLFAVVKYAKSIFNKNDEGNKEILEHYPQNFWAELRKNDGKLRNADFFIENYFNSGILKTFEYLASLNYRVKYLYHGEVLGSDNNTTTKYLANAAAFNGSRRIKVKNWLTKRLRFMDFMMNVNGLNIDIGGGCSLPKPDDVKYGYALRSNNDISVLHSAFDEDNANKALSNFSGEVEIYAPKHTPFIFSGSDGRAVEMYLLPGGERPNLLNFVISKDVNTRFYGSGMFTSVNKIETMFTEFKSIVSDNIEKITYGNTGIINTSIDGGFSIDAKSATEIIFNIPNIIGELKINDNCISLEKINISNSKLYGDFIGFSNLKEINISGVNSNDGKITVSGSNYLTGDRFYISGNGIDNKTTLNALIISDVTGNFNCNYTHIGEIQITNSTDKSSEFHIVGDTRLSSLTLKGFKKVFITRCNNLETLNIDDSLEELYINLEKGKDEVSSKLKKISLDSKNINQMNIDYGSINEIYVNENGEVKYITGDNNENKEKVEIIYSKSDGTGIFDLTNYINLKKVTLINCDNLVRVRLPDGHDVETDGMYNNLQLRWIDTGVLPAFRDDDNSGNDGYVNGKGKYEGIYFPIYSIAPKLKLCKNGVFNNCPNYAMLRSDWDKSQEMIDFNYIAYTNIIVSNKCTSLNNTFSVNSIISNDNFNMDTAIRFIEKCVPDDVKGQIVSLSGCFKGRRNVIYDISNANSEKKSHDNDYGGYINDLHQHPMLVQYEALNDISGMYNNTGVVFVSKFLLDLPLKNNNPNNKLSWGDFITGMNRMNISDDALYNISYRLNSFSNMNFTIYKHNGNNYAIVGKSKEDIFRICDFFFPFKYNEGDSEYNNFYENGIAKPYINITSIETLNFGDQYIDFRGMFNLFPKVTKIHSFLNSNLSKYEISGLLKPCKCITSIKQSFCDSSRINEIDLYDFFNWEENTPEVEELFEGNNILSNGFTIKKRISFDNFGNVLKRIEKYSELKLKNLTNLFSHCTITNYNNEVITFENVLPNIINISNLFESCTSDFIPDIPSKDNESVYNGGVLNIGRPLFEKLPNVTLAQRTFANTCLSSPLTYDYFCKRSKNLTSKQVLLSVDNKEVATLYNYSYNSNIYNLIECFYNVKFVKCKNWFDPDDISNRDLIRGRNYIETDNRNREDSRGFVYYEYDNMTGSYKSYILDNDIIDDCYDNYTDFVPRNVINDITWYNHNLSQEFKYYGNIIDGNKPFDPENVGLNNTIQQTYCCLPPDFLYGCISDANIDGIFANSNIIGVIPRNLTKNIKNQYIPNIFRNVNIMPNLEYYYDEKGSLNEILNDITDIVGIDGGSDSDWNEYTVVFRDDIGRLKKRKPVSSDRNLGQFVYIPANYTMSNNISNVFNFRYNLPLHWEMPGKLTIDDGIKISSYKSTSDFENAINTGELKISNLSYHSQYYFTTDTSVNWRVLNNAKSVFISSSQDIDFIGRERQYCDMSIGSISGKNTWTTDYRVSTSLYWNTYNIENFHIDLNLCGRKNEYNMIVDNGCPIVVKNRTVYLDNFISDILTVFLNGRIFYDDFAVNDLTTSNHKTNSNSYIIRYYGFGKNMILPKFNGTPEDDFVFIPVYNDSIYYDFMVDADETIMNNYNQYFAANKLSDNKYLFIKDKNKYTFK